MLLFLFRHNFGRSLEFRQLAGSFPEQRLVQPRSQGLFPGLGALGTRLRMVIVLRSNKARATPGLVFFRDSYGVLPPWSRANTSVYSKEYFP